MRALWLSVLVLLVGCETRSAGISSPELAADGTLTAPLGEHVDVLMYLVTSGFETQGWRCDSDEDRIASSDPAALDAHDTGSYGLARVNGEDVEARRYQITGLRLGDAELHVACAGQQLTATVHVVP